MSEFVVCPKCSAENPASQHFCGSCGNPLERICSNCGAKNSLTFRFCGNCGSPLEASRDALREERRWATVVFADLSGFTSAAERMDPEDVRAMIDRCMEKLGAIVDRHGGHTEKIVGDELMAVFGARTSHGDDAERAVRAALDMQTCRNENSDIFGDLELHIGINTGDMMFAPVGPGESRNFTVMGDAVNVASRLTAAAPGSGVLVGEETHRATRRAISYEELEPLVVKGKSEPLRSWRAIEPLRGPAERPVSEVPLVGRDAEFSLVLSVWERVRSGSRPHLVTTIGPPGIGKTRLARELIARVQSDGGRVLIGRSLPYGEMSGYGAFAQQIKSFASILETDTQSEAKEKFDAAMSELFGDSKGNGTLRALEAILGLESNGVVGDKSAILLAARRFVEALGTAIPTLLMFEDIHWADPTLLDLIQTLGTRVRDSRVLLLCLTRPEIHQTRPDWGAGLPSYVALALDPLSANDSISLARALLTSRHGLSSEAEEIVGRAGGNPLFIEELSASVVEGGFGRDKELPGGIKEIIAARLDALPSEERTVLLEASVVGKVFWQGAVARIVEVQDLESTLDSLEEKDFVRRELRSQLGNDEEFTFKHMLIREVAYGTLPKARRRESHATVARFIEEAFSDRADESASLLAHHWLEAGEIEKAIDYLLVAAERAARSWAKGESVRLYEQALGLVPADDEERRALIELAMSLVKVEMGDYAGAYQQLPLVVPKLDGRDLGVALIAQTKSAYWQTDAAGAKAGAERAQRLVDTLQDSGLKALLHKELMNISYMDGDFETMWHHADVALENWPPGTMATDLAILYSGIGNVRSLEGNFQEALEAGRRAYEMGLDLQHQESFIVGGSAVGTALTGLNRPEEAISFLEDLIKLSRDLEVAPRLTGRAINMIAGALREMFDLDSAKERNEEAIELGRQASFPNVIFQGKADLIFVDIDAGNIGAARAAIPKMLEEVAALAGWHEWLVRGRLQQARAEAALAASDYEQASEAAIASIKEATGRRPKYHALGRLALGSALLATNKLEQARNEFQAALTLAEKTGHGPTLWRCLGGLARLEFVAGNDDAAAKAHKRAISIIHDYASRLGVKRKETFLDTREIEEIRKLAE